MTRDGKRLRESIRTTDSGTLFCERFRHHKLMTPFLWRKHDARNRSRNTTPGVVFLPALSLAKTSDMRYVVTTVPSVQREVTLDRDQAALRMRHRPGEILG